MKKPSSLKKPATAVKALADSKPVKSATPAPSLDLSADEVASFQQSMKQIEQLKQRLAGLVLDFEVQKAYLIEGIKVASGELQKTASAAITARHLDPAAGKYTIDFEDKKQICLGG